MIIQLSSIRVDLLLKLGGCTDHKERIRELQSQRKHHVLLASQQFWAEQVYVKVTLTPRRQCLGTYKLQHVQGFQEWGVKFQRFGFSSDKHPHVWSSIETCLKCLKQPVRLSWKSCRNFLSPEVFGTSYKSAQNSLSNSEPKMEK